MEPKLMSAGNAGLVPVPTVEVKPDFAKTQVALAAPQPSKAISAEKGGWAGALGIIAVVLWGAFDAAAPLITPDILNVLLTTTLGAWLAEHPQLSMLLIPAITGGLVALRNYRKVAGEAMAVNRSASGVERVAVPPPAILIRTPDILE